MSDYVGNRLAARVPCRLRIKIRGKNLKERLYHTLDISAGGAFIPSKTAPKLGTEVEIGLYLPYSKKPIKIKGKVRRLKWAGNFKHIEGFAVQFRKMDREDEDKFYTFLNKISNEDF